MASKSFVLFFGLVLASWQMDCTTPPSTDKFGKRYNSIRRSYGSPVIHDYMELKMNQDSFQYWETPLSIQDTIVSGYHAGKGYYIHPDSVLQEDDIFRKRISASTFVFIGILTMGNAHEHRFRSIYYDTVCAADIQLKDFNKPCGFTSKPNTDEISIEKADSILHSWGTARDK